MASLSEAEARLVIAAASEPGDHRVASVVAQHGAQECLARPELLPPGAVSRLDASAIEQLGRHADCHWVTPGHDWWPAELSVLQTVVPIGLWFRAAAWQPPAVAVSVVGARSATQYGEYMASEIAAGLEESGLAVVSGGAYGIDAAAHRGALAVRGQTIAVLAGGVDVPYPRSNHALFERILERGALVSEVMLGIQPLRHRFLVRNRLIAAWGAATVVVEARERSGALNTATQAGTLGRDVFAVPGPVTSAASAGCHRLIRDGAVLVTGAADVIESLQSG